MPLRRIVGHSRSHTIAEILSNTTETVDIPKVIMVVDMLEASLARLREFNSIPDDVDGAYTPSDWWAHRLQSPWDCLEEHLCFPSRERSGK